MTTPRTILFAGGGSGGHIFPNVAITERIAESGAQCDVQFIVSNRQVDAMIMQQMGSRFVALPVKPFSTRPWKWPAFLAAYRNSRAIVGKLIDDYDVAAVVATGGFVSGPAIAEAAKRGCPTVVVNLDAAPGRANRAIAPKASQLYTCYKTDALPTAQEIGLPIRRCALPDDDRDAAYKAFDLDPDKQTLFITGASQGAGTINEMMMEMTQLAVSRGLLNRVQILHLAGAEKDVDAVRSAYAKANVQATVLPFLEQMGQAWTIADLAISRAGAGSVAEAWAAAVPTMFFPYPWHKDQHQKLNCQAIVTAGAGVLLTDQIDPTANARQLTGPLAHLLDNPGKVQNMRAWLTQNRPPDGAAVIAQWLRRHLK